MVELDIIAIATLTTFGRVMLIIGGSIFSGWLLSYFAIKSKIIENIFVTVISVFESVPVFSFIPIILILFIQGFGGIWGSEMAADFLVFTAVVWNIWIGIYQAYKTAPGHLIEVCSNYNFGFSKIMRFLYIPFSMPRIAGNISPSFANALFYITISEVFTVGTSHYHTFGIGSFIAQATAQGDFTSIYYSLLFLAIGVVCITFLFYKFSKEVVAKYSLDTELEIKRGGRNFRGHRTKLVDLVRKGTSVIPKYRRKTIGTEKKDEVGENEDIIKLRSPRFSILSPPKGVRPKMTLKYGKPATVAAVLIALVFLVHSIGSIVLSVPHEQWSRYFALTPYLFFSMLVDYVRVLVVTAIALVFAVSLGYYLVLHEKAVHFSLPALQTLGSFPAPAYFPLVFTATLPFLQGSIGSQLSTELYVLLLAFLSVFYYAIFNFWIGIQVIPSEFWDIMHTYKIPFFTRLRRIILPATFPFMVSGISSTINSAWGGLAVAEYWTGISGNHNLEIGVGMMKVITSNTATGNIGIAAWTSFLFAITVVVFGILFTRKLMDLAQKKYVVEEGIYQA